MNQTLAIIKPDAVSAGKAGKILAHLESVGFRVRALRMTRLTRDQAGAFYAVVDVSKWANGDPLALAVEFFEAEDVIIVPGTAFGPSGDWFWRISYAAGAEALVEGVSRMARFLNTV